MTRLLSPLARFLDEHGDITDPLSFDEKLTADIRASALKHKFKTDDLNVLVDALDVGDCPKVQRFDAASAELLCFVLIHSEPCRSQQRGLLLLAAAIHTEQFSELKFQKFSTRRALRPRLSDLLRMFDGGMRYPELTRRYAAVLALEIMSGSNLGDDTLSNVQQGLVSLGQTLTTASSYSLRQLAGILLHRLNTLGVPTESLFASAELAKSFSDAVPNNVLDSQMLAGLANLLEECSDHRSRPIAFTSLVTIGNRSFVIDKQAGIMISISKDLGVLTISIPPLPKSTAVYIDIPLESAQLHDTRLSTKEEAQKKYVIEISLTSGSQASLSINSKPEHSQRLLLGYTWRKPADDTHVTLKSMLSNGPSSNEIRKVADAEPLNASRDSIKYSVSSRGESEMSADLRMQSEGHMGLNLVVDGAEYQAKSYSDENLVGSTPTSPARGSTVLDVDSDGVLYGETASEFTDQDRNETRNTPNFALYHHNQHSDSHGESSSDEAQANDAASNSPDSVNEQSEIRSPEANEMRPGQARVEKAGNGNTASKSIEVQEASTKNAHTQNANIGKSRTRTQRKGEICIESTEREVASSPTAESAKEIVLPTKSKRAAATQAKRKIEDQASSEEAMDDGLVSSWEPKAENKRVRKSMPNRSSSVKHISTGKRKATTAEALPAKRKKVSIMERPSNIRMRDDQKLQPTTPRTKSQRKVPMIHFTKDGPQNSGLLKPLNRKSDMPVVQPTPRTPLAATAGNLRGRSNSVLPCTETRETTTGRANSPPRKESTAECQPPKISSQTMITDNGSPIPVGRPDNASVQDENPRPRTEYTPNRYRGTPHEPAAVQAEDTVKPAEAIVTPQRPRKRAKVYQHAHSKKHLIPIGTRNSFGSSSPTPNTPFMDRLQASNDRQRREEDQGQRQDSMKPVATIQSGKEQKAIHEEGPPWEDADTRVVMPERDSHHPEHTLKRQHDTFSSSSSSSSTSTSEGPDLFKQCGGREPHQPKMHSALMEVVKQFERSKNARIMEEVHRYQAYGEGLVHSFTKAFQAQLQSNQEGLRVAAKVLKACQAELQSNEERLKTAAKALKDSEKILDKSAKDVQDWRREEEKMFANIQALMAEGEE